ncbi:MULTISPECIES: ABC transporter permease [Eubacterium]|jgi:ribose transport system permease protein|uniref:ABC transporter permease n=1 Tax=Eubacterium album TaxID=2978477 RepID=A0ABT2LZW4_9FIRM|nr:MULTISPECIES: ABC transporter permease [unclassified Eubacterium (in: firmicutes)]MCT7398176.1 ABC transporter permease [Eubacterium sp. LFL-14]RGG67476.1 ABC transporter permease [Eubacterium sp. AF17-7]RHR35242.1 ABC transporter permease [Eubacterium sp. AF19-12LB]
MKGIWNKYKREFVVLIATLAMCVVFTVLNKNFLNYSNFLTVLQQMVLNGILAVGMMFTIITGGIDLSVGCTYAITGIVVASCTVNYGMNPFLAILVGILIGAVLGAFNGFLINQLKLQPFIATLGTMSLYRGIAYVVTGGVPVTNVPTSYRDIFNGIVFGGVRNYIIVMVVVFVIAHILLSKMRSGDYLYAVGGNEEAAKLSGVNVIKTKYIAYIFCGICAAIAGMIMLASLGSAEATAGQAYETNAIAAAAIGGTRMAGGKGTALGTFIGALMLAVLKVGMVVINVDSFWQFVVTGIIIIVASYFEFIQQDIKGFVARHKKAAN